MGVRPSPRVRMMLCTFFRNGELRLQGSCRRLEGGYAGGDVVAHTVLVKVVHLFLNGTIDTRVTRMQAYDEFSLVIELLHYFKLFLQIHGAELSTVAPALAQRVSSLGTRLPAYRMRSARSSILASAYGNQVRVARAGTHYFDVALAHSSYVKGGGHGIVLSFLLGYQQPGVVCTQQGGGFADAGGAHVLHDGFAGMGHLYLCQFLGCIEVDRELLLERFHYRFVTFWL